MGQKPAKTPCRAADYTIRIMLRTLRRQGAKVLPSNSRVRRRQERAWRQWPACTRPFASPAPGRGIGAPISPIPLPRCRSASASSIRHRHLPHQPQSSASILPPYALRAGRHVCDSLWPDKQSTKSQEPLLQGTASPCSTWPLFLQALCLFRLVRGPRFAAVRARLQSHKAFRAARTQPSRRLAQSMPVSQRTMRQSRLPALPARTPRCPSYTARIRPLERSRVGASIRRSVPVRGNRRTPHQRHLALTPVGCSSPGPGGRLPSHNVGLFRCSREPCVSLPRRSRARRPSRCQTASRATLHSLRSFRALGHWETLSRAPARTASR